METKDIIKMYDLVFQDAVRCYLEDNGDGVKVDENIIKKVAYDLIYNDDYLWEEINDHIHNYLKRYMGGKNGRR